MNETLDFQRFQPFLMNLTKYKKIVVVVLVVVEIVVIVVEYNCK